MIEISQDIIFSCKNTSNKEINPKTLIILFIFKFK
jgi:hypothetical protein